MNGKRIAGLLVLLAVIGLVVLVGLSGLGGGDGVVDTGGNTATGTTEIDPEAAARAAARRAKKWKREGEGKVVGVLKEFGTDRPLAGLTVTLYAGRPGPDQTHETTSGPDGSFAFPVVTNFTDWLFTAHAKSPLKSTELPAIEVKPGETTELGTVYLLPDFHLSGVVVNDVGDPVPGAKVKAVRARPQEDRANILRLIREVHLESTAIEAATTKDDGTFRLERLVPGTYDLEASKPGYRLRIRRDIVVTPQIQDRTIRIVLQAGFQLEGRVIRNDGGPLAGLPVVAFEQPRQNLQNLTLDRRFATTDDDGAFLLDGLGAGDYMVTVHPRGRPIAMANNVAIPNTKRVDITIGGNAWLEGRVTNAEGQAVANADIFVVGLDQRRPRVADATTDGSGRYRIDGLESGDNGLLMVQAAGYGAHPQDFMRRVLRGQGGLVLKPGENRKDIVLGDGGTLRGTVISRDDEAPMSGVKIALKSPRSFFGGTPSAVTAEDGTFEITGIPMGTSVLFAEKEGWLLPGLSPATLLSAIAGSMGGGGQDTGRGNTIVFSEPGQVIEREVKLVRGAYVSGVVLDPQGNAVAGAQVSLQFASDNGWMDQILPLFTLGEAKVTGADGSFRIAAPPPGQGANVIARADGYLDGKSDELKLLPGKDADGVQVTLREGAVLQGTVTDAKGKPLSGAQVRYLRMNDNEWSNRWALRNAEPTNTLEDGTYRMRNVQTGKLIVSVSHPEYLTVSRENVEATEGKGAKLDWKLTRGATLEGRVLDSSGQPLAGAEVTFSLIGERPADIDKYFTDPPDPVTDADGRFRVDGLIPGRYRLVADAADAAPSDPVEVRTGEPATLRLAPAYVIAGHVRGPDGGALGGVQIEVHSEDRGRVDRTRSAADGTFRMEGLPAGTYRLEVNQGWRSGTDAPNVVPARVEGVQAGSEGVLVQMSAGEIIAGTVIGPDGQPIVRGWAAAREIANPEGRDRVAIGDLVIDGKFTLKGLPPGDYRVTFMIENGGNRDAVIQAGSRDVRIDLSAGGVVRGRVVDDSGQPAPPGTQVRAVGDGRTFDARVEQDGSYEIRGVEPGTYRVVVSRKINKVNYSAEQTDVVVTEGITDVDLVMVPGE